ncbi:MAG TPA: SPOR domain-containing protein [Xanthomonadales bacterium]|nr:SPOR domain-containing protein [Xanthomonadales bacterium]
MFARIAFLLLLAANVGLAAWLAVTPSRPDRLPRNDEGVAPLVLLSEHEETPVEAATAELSEAPEEPAEAQRDRCISLGPFPSQSDLRRALNALTPAVRRIQFRESRTSQSRGFIVYLPAPPTREQALAVARELYGKGVRDYYVVTAGEQQNTISLGLFKERANADRRLADLRGLGFAPSVSERTETLPVYWIDYAVAPDSTFDWRDRLPDLLDLQEKPVQCF